MTPFVLFLLTVIIIVFIKFFFQVLQFTKFCIAINKIPGPARYPLPTLAFELKNLKPEDRFQWVCDLVKKYRKSLIMTTMQLNEAVVTIYHPRHMEIIFPSTENIKKSFVYDNLDPWLGKGLLTSSGKKWFHERKLLTPAFHFGVVDQFSDVMAEKAKVLTDIIETKLKENPDKPIDVFQLIIRCALDIICETAMGVNMNVQINHDTDYMNALHKVAETRDGRGSDFLLPHPPNPSVKITLTLNHARMIGDYEKLTPNHARQLPHNHAQSRKSIF